MKRATDIVIASVVLVVSIPLLVTISLAVLATSGPPVIFRQWRPGLHERPFEMLKFRTMRSAPVGVELSDDLRLTGFGRLLRQSSLDELPELVNVIRGEMSVVGPRPLLLEYLPLYDQHQRRRHETRPGLTGLAQVNGRNRVTWERRLQLDVEYVDRWSMRLDLEIMCRTIGLILSRKGISEPGHVTMSHFAGGSGDRLERR